MKHHLNALGLRAFASIGALLLGLSSSSVNAQTIVVSA
jgi:hypothetical protein